MLEYLHSYTHKEFLFAIVYISAMLTGVFISRRSKVQPISTLLLILISTITYLIITNILSDIAQPYMSDQGRYGGSIILVGISGVFFALRLCRGLLRTPSIVSHYILAMFLLFFSFVQVKDFLIGNPQISQMLYSIPFSNSLGSWSPKALQLTASVYPELTRNTTMVFELAIAIVMTLSYLLFIKKFKYPGNRFLFTLLLLMTLLFISFFGINPSSIPAMSDRLMGLNVAQWGILLVIILLSAYILGKELSSRRYKKEVLRKAPAETTLLLIFLILLLFSFQVSSLFTGSEIKILLTGYFIMICFIATLFLKRIEKQYIRYGTVSIILIIFILFIHLEKKTGSVDVFEKERKITPQNLIETSSGLEELHSSLHSNYRFANSAIPAGNIHILLLLSPDKLEIHDLGEPDITNFAASNP
jgi:hypothetical protein